MPTAEQFVLPPENQPLAAYSEFRAQLGTLREQNAALVFDYASAEGNKAARSHIHKLRRTKGAVESARKEAKAASLEYGRRVDSEGKEIIAEIEAMIDVHERPINEIEEAERNRVEAIAARIQHIQSLGLTQGAADDLRAARDALAAIEIDETFEESMADATVELKAARHRIAEALEAAEKAEAEAAELEKLRAESAAREQREREERIAKEAAERASKEAEEAASRERERAEKAERDRKAAEERAARAEQEAKDRLRREAEEQARRQAEETAKREADKEHRRAINNAATVALSAESGIELDAAQKCVEAIARKQIPNVSISY